LYTLTEGEHVVDVTAFDLVGNNASTSVRFKVDTSQEPTGFAAFLAAMDPLTITLITVIVMLTIGLALFYRQKGIDEEKARIERVRARREKEKREFEEAKARAKAAQAKKERKRKKSLAGIDIPEEEFEGELPVTKKGTIEPDPGEAAIPVFRSEAEKELARLATEQSLEAELEARRLRKKGQKDGAGGEKAAAASGKTGGTGAAPVNRLRR